MLDKLNPNSTFKRCTYCSEQKNLADFHKNKRSKDGRAFRCKKCACQLRRQYTKENPGAGRPSKEYLRKYYQDNRAERLQWQKEYRQRNLEARKKYDRERHKVYYQLNKDKFLERYARRRASKLNATPSWLTKEQRKEMKYIYSLAKDCKTLTGEEYHVDHIVPLQGENVCGLHVPWNLQILPSDLNLSKANKHVEDDQPGLNV